MNRTHSLTIDFGTDEVSDATVQSFPSPHAHVSEVSPHRFTGLNAAVGRRQACRAWPSAHGLIYVVDGYPGLAQLAKTILDVEGFPTCAFDDRVKAWQAFAFAEPRPTLLITDNLDGNVAAMELIRRCRAVEPTLKTLLVDHGLSSGDWLPDPNLVDGLLSLPYCGPVLIQEARRLCTGLSGRNGDRCAKSKLVFTLA